MLATITYFWPICLRRIDPSHRIIYHSTWSILMKYHHISWYIMIHHGISSYQFRSSSPQNCKSFFPIFWAQKTTSGGSNISIDAGRTTSSRSINGTALGHLSWLVWWGIPLSFVSKGTNVIMCHGIYSMFGEYLETWDKEGEHHIVALPLKGVPCLSIFMLPVYDSISWESRIGGYHNTAIWHLHMTPLRNTWPSLLAMLGKY